MDPKLYNNVRDYTIGTPGPELVNNLLSLNTTASQQTYWWTHIRKRGKQAQYTLGKNVRRSTVAYWLQPLENHGYTGTMVVNQHVLWQLRVDTIASKNITWIVA